MNGVAFVFAVILNVPFFIYEFIAAMTFVVQDCLDGYFGAGMTLRQWFFSSAVVGVSLFGVQLLIYLFMIILPQYRKSLEILTKLNILCFSVYFCGYKLYGIVFGMVIFD